MHRPTPYIGVTGFMNADEVQTALSAMEGSKRKLMVGVLASAKTMRGEPNKWPNRFPFVERIANIFCEDPNALNLIHFATDDRNTIDAQLVRMIELGGKHLDGFQLNMVWPDSNLLRRTFVNHHLRVVLQIGTNAYKQMDANPLTLAKHLDEYRELVTDILFDLSGGLGTALNAEAGLPVLRAVRERHPELGLGIAGGLSAETMHLIDVVAQEFPDVNIDAEGKIRDNADAPLNLTMTTAYIQAAAHQFA